MNGERLSRPSLESIQAAVSLLHPRGGIFECRMFGSSKGTICGYFDNFFDLGRALEPWHGRVSIYASINALKPELLARARNRLVAFARVATSAEDVIARQWFPMDVDSVRPRGIPADEHELQAALGRRDEVVRYLSEAGGFPPPLGIMSGNGGWALWRVNLPNTKHVSILYRAALKALDQRFSDGAAKVDPAVHSAAQLMKLCTTVAVTGDTIPGRPRRRVITQGIPLHLLDGPQLVVMEQLQWLAGQIRMTNPTYSLPPSFGAPNLVDLFKTKGLYRRPLDSD